VKAKIVCIFIHMKKMTFLLIVLAALAFTSCGSGTPTTETIASTDSTAVQIDTTAAPADTTAKTEVK
jgi:hypothetical protein